MASFADSISQFNPYIQQLPVEAMTQVGMYKQQKYDEGIQKVQSYIDNVAGLEVVKPLQKAYLQSKLNELGSKLKTVAAGDFSNYQLVNSVGGMATQIAKDPTIQSAVLSTQKIKRGEQDLDAARKAGKNSVQNEAWWNKTTNDWMSDGSLDSSFNGRYVEYRDMEEKLRGVAKEVHEYDKSIETPFKRDNQGNVLYFYKDAKGGRVATTDPSKGAPEIDEAILKTKVKGKSAEKILENFYMSLDENDKQQLGIDGWYHYRGYTGDNFKTKVKQDIKNTFDDRKKAISEEIVKLSVEISSNNKLTTDQLEEKRARLKNYIALSKGGGLDKQLAERLSSVDTSDELSLKQSVYTEKMLTGLANTIAYQDIETEFKDNPYFKALMDKKKLEFDYWKAVEGFKRDDLKIQIDQANLAIAKSKELRESQKFYKEMVGEVPVFEAAGLSTDAELPGMKDLRSAIDMLNGDMNTFRVTYGRDIIGSDFDNMTEVEQRNALKLKLDEYLANPKIIKDNTQRKLMDRYRAMSIDMTRRTSNYMTVHNKSKVYDNRVEELIKNQGNLTDSKGNVLSAKEVTEVLADIKNNVILKTRKTKEGDVVTLDYSKLLEKYKGTKYETLVRDKESDKTYLKTFDRQVGNAVSRILQEKDAFERQAIGRMMPQYQMAVAALNTEDDVTKKAVNKVISEMYSLHSGLGQLDEETKKQFDPSTITEWRTGKGGGDLRYVLRKNQDNSSGFLEIIKGDEVQKIPLNKRQLRKYFPSAVQTTFMESVKPMVEGSPNKTTNAMGITENSGQAAINAAFTGEALPLISQSGLASLVRFDIEGDPDNVGDENDLYQLRMYVIDENGTWKGDVVNQQGYGTYEGIMTMMKNIGVDEYLRILNSK